MLAVVIIGYMGKNWHVNTWGLNLTYHSILFLFVCGIRLAIMLWIPWMKNVKGYTICQTLREIALQMKSDAIWMLGIPRRFIRPTAKQPFQRVDRWRALLADAAWTKIDVRDGEKGPPITELVKRRVVARTERGWDDCTEELLVVTRTPESSGTMKYDYYLSNAPVDTSLDELARVVKAGHHIEDCLKRAKSEAGLSDYEVRTWNGWHHHQTLSLIALWFLTFETLRGKKHTPALTVPQVWEILYMLLREACNRTYPGWAARCAKRKSRQRELARFYHYKRHKLLAPLKVKERK